MLNIRNCDDLKKVLHFLSINVKQFECCGCHSLVLEPFRTTCFHLLCHQCVIELFSRGHAICPIDKTLLSSREELVCDPLVARQILQLTVFCPNANSKGGCDETCYLHQLEDHMRCCKFAAMLCPQGCKQHIPRSSLTDHIQLKCSHRTGICRWCNSKIVFNSMEAHYNEECPLIVIPCSSCKQVELPRSQMNLHMKSCPARVQTCKFAELGCTFQGRDIAAHESNYILHFDILLEYNLKQKVTLDLMMAKMKTEMEEIRNENKLLKDDVEHNDDTMTIVKEHVDVLTIKVVAIQKYLKFNKQIDNSSVKLIENAEMAPNNAVVALQQKLAEIEVLTKYTADSLQIEKSTRAGDQKAYKAHEVQLNKNEIRLAALREKIRIGMHTSHNGIFVWKLDNFSKYQDEASAGKGPSLYSTPFYTDQYGYKVCLNLHPIGDDSVRGTHMSLFLVVLKGHMDEILAWPFCYKASITLVDQVTWKADYEHHFVSNPTSQSTQKPKTERNQGYGFTKFFDLDTLYNSPLYLVDDTIFIKATVEVSKE